MFIGGYKIFDGNKMFTVEIPSGDNVTYLVGKDAVDQFKSANKPILVTNLSINHHQLGKFTIEGYATRHVANGVYTYKVDKVTIMTVGDDSIRFILDV